jgi:hypothetical protein
MSKGSIGEIIGGAALIAGAIVLTAAGGLISVPLANAMIMTGASFLIGGTATGVASLLDNKGGMSTATKNPIGPWGYVYGYQIVSPTIIFEESNNSQGTSNNKELHQVLACACHPCQIGALGQWQLRINGKIIPMQQSGTSYVGAGYGNQCATATATVNPITGQVVAVNVTNGGSGYGVAPSISFSGGGGSGAVATATISGGSVQSIHVTNGGSGYYGGAPPCVSIATPDGGYIGAGQTPNGVGFDSYSPSQTSSAVSSISRSSGVVTVHLATALPNYNGQAALIRNVADNTYNGTWVLTQPNPADATVFTYLCGGADGSSSGGTVNTTYPDYSNKIHVEWLDGNHKATFPGLLASNTSWTANDLCLGRCVMYLRMGYDAAYFPYGPPNVSVVMMGKNDILDTRTSQRGYTDNAALCIADFMSLPPSKGGFGLTIGTDIPSASLTAAANVCDETINLAGGGTLKQYTCNSFFQLSTGRGSILQDMLTSCAGRLSFQGGTYQIFPHASVASTLALTDADMYGGMKFRPRLSIRDTCNSVKGVYTGQENNWQQADFPPYMQDAIHGYASDVWLAEDRGERIFKDVHLPCTSTSAVAQKLAKIEMLRTRYQVRGTIRCSMRAYKLVALDTLTLTHPRYGWTNKLFEVVTSKLVMEKIGNVPTLAVELDLAETDPTIDDWSSIEQLTPQAYREPANAGMQIVSPPERFIVYSGPANPSHVPPLPNTVVTGADGVARNNLWCTWISPNDPHVMSGGHIEIQWKQSSDSTWASAGKFDPSTTQCWMGAVSDGTAYDVQIRSVNCAGVYSTWVSVLGTVISSTASIIGPATITFPRAIGIKPPTIPNPARPTLDDLMPLGQWADNTAGQAFVYAGTTESIVPNGDFLLGNIDGWFLAETYAPGPATFGYDGTGAHGLLINGGGNTGVGSSSFRVIPGQKYRFVFYVWAGSGTQSVYLRVNYATTYVAQITQSNRSGYTDLMANGSIANGVPTSYSYDWTCPAGVNYASAAVYGWNTATSPIAVGKVSCIPYSAAAQWGADVTGSNTAGDVQTGAGKSVAEPGANVTAGHVLTSVTQASPGTTLSSASFAPINGASFSVSASGANDVYNLWMQFVASGQTGDSFYLKVMVDGANPPNTSQWPSYSASFIYAGAAGAGAQNSFFMLATVSGLSAGAHTIQFYGAKGVYNTVIASLASVTCQRIF